MALYLADTSAWNRSKHVADRWTDLVERRLLALCTPVALELLFSARDRADYRALAYELTGFPHLSLNDEVDAAAARTQASLAERSQYRGVPVTDLLVAATAEVHGATLLHYDRHFDLIARATGQPMEWLAPRGRLD